MYYLQHERPRCIGRYKLEPEASIDYQHHVNVVVMIYFDCMDYSKLAPNWGKS